MVLDIVKTIDQYPELGMLTYITSSKRAIGGCAPNTATDLATIDTTLPVSVMGRIGDDEYGRFLVEKLRAKGIDVSGVSVSNTVETSYTDVMNISTGERTFFNAKGANAEFSPEHIDASALNCKIFHIGYILLLDKFDEEDPEFGTVMARFLRDIHSMGIKTSVDVVSNSDTSLYKTKILPVMPYTDYLIINEIEICNIWGIDPRNADGSLNADAVKLAMEKTMAYGVNEKIIIHAKEACFCLDKSGEFTKLGSLKIPSELIAGSVGAGDAFCAGCLYGLYNEYSDMEILEFASAAAACSLFAENSVDGMKNKKEIIKISKSYERREV
jgi:sugar/nucleoside kinase (ribokinase family)